jgi:hypothetical protein
MWCEFDTPIFAAYSASAGNPDFDFVFLTDNSATSNYNALQLKFQQRFWSM